MKNPRSADILRLREARSERGDRQAWVDRAAWTARTICPIWICVRRGVCHEGTGAARLAGGADIRSRHSTLFGLQLLLVGAALLWPLTGCAVHQPRGLGLLERVREPETGRRFWLYLPEQYVSGTAAERNSRRWPMVVSCHGLKPFDNARPQALEWEAEADRYGFIVVAPELRAPDVLAQFPVRSRHSAFVEDERCTVAIVDHVVRQYGADAENVLATSWSSGGYLAHSLLNQYPDKFTCLAVRQSNFSEHVLDSSKTPRSLYAPILIVNTEHDVGICLSESRRAREWYASHGFKNCGWVLVRGLGHERTPDVAASFFAQVAGVQPRTPSEALARRQVIDGNAEGLAVLAGTLSRGVAKRQPALASAGRQSPAEPRTDRTAMELNGGVRSAGPQDAGRPPARPTPGAAGPVGIRLTTAVGIEPLNLGFSADCPADWLRSGTFLWSLNGDPLCTGSNGQKTLTRPGEYVLELLVLTSGGVEYRASRTIRVMPQQRSATGAAASMAPRVP